MQQNNGANLLIKIEHVTQNLLSNEGLIKILGKHTIQIFNDQDPKQKVPSFRNVLKKLRIKVIKPPQRPWELRYSYKNSAGATKVFLHNKFSPDKPSFIFHHGLGESIKTLHLKVITNDIFFEKFNIFSIRASHHENGLSVYKYFTNDFQNMSCGMAASVKTIEEIIKFHKDLTDSPIIICGISLGGIIASLHYFHYGSASLYFPIIAYPNFSEIILDKNHKKIIYNQKQLAKNKSIVKSFAIPLSLKRRRKDIIFPILGEHDEIVNYQKSVRFWKDYKVTTFNMGHWTFFSKRKEIRNYILSKTEQIR